MIMMEESISQIWVKSINTNNRGNEKIRGARNPGDFVQNILGVKEKIQFENTTGIIQSMSCPNSAQLFRDIQSAPIF